MFKIIALRVLDGCPKNFRKCLDNKKTYFFDNSYEDVEDTDFVRKKQNVEQKLRVYDIKGHEGRIIQVEVSAIVGKNGEGKSTLIELMLRILNNFACTMGFRASQETLCYVKGLRACLFYEVNNTIYCVRCDDHGTKWFEGNREIGHYEGTSSARLNNLMEYHRQQLFYTLVINYALYSYNSNIFAYETPGNGSWLDGLFHKNDSYQTPLVLNPMRTNGIINVNKELDLSVQRLMAVFTEAGSNKNQRIVSDGVEAYGFAFSLDKKTKLLDVTLRQYFENVVDDECRMRDDLESSNPEEVGKELISNFHEFFSSFHDLLDKNDCILRWLSGYEVDHPIKHDYPELAKYVDIMAQVFEEEKDGYYFDLIEEMDYFLPGRPLRWMNFAQLYRLLLLMAVWEVLREINVVELEESMETYLQEPDIPTNKAILYIPYKIIEILSTYEPYKKRPYHYDATCEALKLQWPTIGIKEELKRDVESILRKDDYTTMKLHQTINYLKKQQGGMYQAEKIARTPEGYEWFVTFEKLKAVIGGDNMRLSELIKHLPPPVFKGEIELKNEKDETYALSTLSSGQMQRLNSAGALVYHLRNLDYRIGEQQRLEYDYVSVIFEEVELYFHPEFQRTLINYLLEQMKHAGLKNIKGIHLIFVTHSPFILTDMLDNNVIYLSLAENLTDVYCYAKNVPRVTEYVFWLTNIKSSVLHVPAASIQQYKNHKEWGKFGKIVRIEPLIQYIIDGEIYKTVIIPEGDAITLEEEPEKEGHTFSGWSEIPTTMPAEDVTVTGSFIPNKYTLTYIVDGEIYKTFEVTYGERITAEKEPQKEKFVFSGWSEIPITMPANDVTITGFFTFGEFQLTYIVDGEPYKIICLDYGTKIIAEMEPEKQGYTFSGWSEIPAKMPAKNVTVTGSFTINKYRLIYMVDDEIYRTYDIDYGAVITSEAEPTKEGYTFSGWSEIPSTMSSMDVIVTGSFTINKYTLTYKVDDEIYKNYEVEYGSDITPENAPTKEGYTFSGWSDIPAIMPAEDVTITGFL